MNFVIYRVSWVDILSVANLLSVRGLLTCYRIVQKSLASDLA